MKKQYLLRGRNAFLTRDRALMLLAGLLVLGILIVRIVFPGALVALASPFWALGSSLTTTAGSGSAVVMDAGKLKTERDALAQQNVVLANENAALTAKVADLTQLIGTEPQTGARIVAGVLARPPVAPYDVLVVGAGTSAGVAEHARVFGPGGVPIGEIASVTATTARVELYSSPGTVTDAWIGEHRTPITLTGTSAGSFTASLSKTASTTQGSPVLVSGPGALPIGSVLRIIDDPSSPTYILQIAPAVNPFSITWVSIDRGL